MSGLERSNTPKKRPRLSIRRREIEYEVRQHLLVRRGRYARIGKDRLGVGRKEKGLPRLRVAERPQADTVARQNHPAAMRVEDGKREVAFQPSDELVSQAVVCG